MLWRSIFIVAYLAFIIGAGFLHIMNAPYAKYTYPWIGYTMFSAGSPVHTEQVLHGFYEDGSEAELDLASFFPMPPWLIYRGHGLGVTYGIAQSFFNNTNDKSLKLCDYIIHKHNEEARDGDRKLAGLEIKFRYYPITREGWRTQKPLMEKPTARCTSQLIWGKTG